MDNTQQWINWITELQAIAQNGLTYVKDIYDKERYLRLREMAAEMMSHITDIPLDKMPGLFCYERGYQTPKIDVRAAMVENDKILLVQENSGKWSIPGGWCDINLSVMENAIKEAKEEAGLDIEVAKVVALQDRKKHNYPPQASSICKVFVLCKVLGGKFEENSETIASGWFGIDNLPELDNGKTTKEQIELCIEASRHEHWETRID
ncbi:MAG: NUDIX hydrolase [Oscillospiraceae bacterium]|nr:NUDIX hydrolase [Oscillospiraceae bacterium]